ncbi:MAG: hypothetical protein AAGA48_28590 [Myxococcota bacterium]
MSDVKSAATFWEAILGKEHGIKVGLMIEMFGHVPDEVFQESLNRLGRLEATGPVLDPSAWLTGARWGNARAMRDLITAARELAKAERKRVSEWRDDAEVPRGW